MNYTYKILFKENCAHFEIHLEWYELQTLTQLQHDVYDLVGIKPWTLMNIFSFQSLGGKINIPKDDLAYSRHLISVN